MVSRNSDLLNIIDVFADQKVLVLGEAMLDSYLQGTVERLCQEAPVPIVDIHETSYLPGGAANTAANLSSLGAQVTFLSVIGDDEAGSKLLQALKQRHIDTEHVLKASNRSTLAKQRILAGSQMIVRFDQGSTTSLDGEMEMRLIERLNLLFRHFEAVVVSDYNHGLMTWRVLQALERLQKQYPRVVIVDSKQLQAYQNLTPTAVKANYEEARQLLALKKTQDEGARLKQISEHGRKSLDLTGAQIVAITLDHSGAMIFHRDDDTPYRTYADPKPNSQAAGAGD